MNFYLVLVLSIVYFPCVQSGKLHPVFTVNCGGGQHTDSNGVTYHADKSNQGIASDYGLRLMIHRALDVDSVLYQTERYDTSSFYYDIPIPSDGDYVLHLKFSEVWFQHPREKVFSVELNGGLTIVDHLDIFDKVGYSTAHDENIRIQIKDRSLITDHGAVKLEDGEEIRVRFVKTDYDNPKVNAIALFRNSLQDIPELPPINVDEMRARETHSIPARDRKVRPSKLPESLVKPPAQDPYTSIDYSAYVIPGLICLVALLPLVFCLTWM